MLDGRPFPPPAFKTRWEREARKAIRGALRILAAAGQNAPAATMTAVVALQLSHVATLEIQPVPLLVR
jgi:hypothetical protein